VWSTVEDLLSPLVKVAALIAGACALAYLCGRRYFDTYFRQVGADWVVGLISPTTMMGMALPVLLSLVTFVGTGLIFVHFHGIKARTLFQVLLLVTALWLIFVVSFYFPDLSDEAKPARFGFIAFGVLGLSIAVVFMIALVEEGHIRLLEAKAVMYTSVLLGFLIFGFQTAGTWSAKLDFYAGTTELPVLLDDKASTRWRLVLAIDPTVFVVALPARAQDDVVLRVIGRDEIKAVVGPPRSPAGLED
jgi:hypothetical protein